MSYPLKYSERIKQIKYTVLPYNLCEVLTSNEFSGTTVFYFEEGKKENIKNLILIYYYINIFCTIILTI